MFGTLIRLVNLPLVVADEVLSHACGMGGTTNRDERLLSGPLSDAADGVDSVERSVKRSVRRSSRRR